MKITIDAHILADALDINVDRAVDLMDTFKAEIESAMEAAWEEYVAKNADARYFQFQSDEQEAMRDEYYDSKLHSMRDGD